MTREEIIGGRSRLRGQRHRKGRRLRARRGPDHRRPGRGLAGPARHRLPARAALWPAYQDPGPGAAFQGCPAAEPPLEVDGVYTAEALAELKRHMPEVPAEELASGLRPSELPRRFRVATFVSLVERLLEEQDRAKGEVGS